MERKQLLGEDFGRFQLIYPTSRKVFLHTINEHPQEAEDVFEKSVIDQCRKYYDHYYGNGENQYDKTAEIGDYCNWWYPALRGDVSEAKKEYRDWEDKKEEIISFFYNNGVFFESLDEKFNSLRH